MLKIVVDQSLKELCEHGTAGFPLQVNHDDLSAFQDKYIACHWHDDLELSVVRQGTALYQINGEAYKLEPGQGLIINAGVPHMVLPDRNSGVILLTILVHPEFLYGREGSDIENICFRPFLRRRELSGILLDPSVDWQSRVLEAFYETDRCYQQRGFGFQLKIKGLLCQAFYEIISANEGVIENGKSFEKEDLRRLKTLLDYIHLHYDRKISLKELADLIYVTRESCCRFFKHMTGKTISRYISDYRVAQGIRLLQENRYSVTQIADLVGFSSASRFAQAFRNSVGCNPTEYLRT